MKSLVRLLFNLNRIALLLLALAFLSFYLVTFDSIKDALAPVIKYSTAYLPVLLVPVTLAMVVLLLLRYISSGEDEKISFGDILSGVIALALQVAVIAVFRVQGNDVAGDSFLANIPNIDTLAVKAAPYGMIGLAVLQFLAFLFYWFADPHPKERD